MRIQVCALVLAVAASLPTGSATPTFTVTAPSGAFYVRIHATGLGGRSPASNEIRIFVNTPTHQVKAAIDLLGIDLAQLHGDEWPEEVQAFGNRAIKVFRSLPVTESQLARYPSVWGYLVDTPNPKLFGGTGVVWDWSSLRAVNSPRPILVAGGINAENARRALAESGATGLDVNSGVESAPGIKNAAKLQRLFEELKGVEI